MKKLSLFMLITAGLAITSCSNDDDNNSLSDDLIGTYELTAANAHSPQDYDGDGDSNSNLVLEGTCYNSSWIGFHEDGTYNESFTSAESASAGLALDCNTKASAGTYVRTGNTITTTRTSGSGTLSATYNFDESTHTLTRSESNGGFSAWDEATSVWANMTGDINLTYVKYTDDDHDNGAGQDDDSNINTSGMDEVHGTFNLTSFVVATAQDLNMDSSSSTDLTDETSCYGDSYIIFHTDGTFEERTAASTPTVSGSSLQCNTANTTGVWSRMGDKVITRQGTGAAMVNHIYTLNTTSNTITRSDDQGMYAGYTASTSHFAMLVGNVTYGYTAE